MAGKIGSAASPITEEVKEQMLEEAYSVTPNFSVDTNNPMFNKATDYEEQALASNSATYDGMAAESQKYYDDLKQNAQTWADTQSQLQQERTDFTIEQIEQQKEQAHEDYLKEQSGAYVDWQKQSNQFGAAAEKMASNGMLGTGYSESSQVSMYNTYQNRVATAREAFSQAVLNYNNSIKDAQLQNNAALAEIAYNALQQQLELSLQGFQYKNQLIIDKANKEIEIKNNALNHWKDIYGLIQQDNALKWDVKSFYDELDWKTEQADIDRQHDSNENALNREHQLAMQKLSEAHDVAMAKLNHEYEIKMLNAKTEKEKELLKIQHENDIKKLNEQLKNEKALLQYQYSLKSSSSSGSSGSKSSGSKVSGSSSGSKSKSFSNVVSRLAGVKSSGSSSSGSSSGATLNTKSVLSLGKGPINGSTVAKMVDNGQATMKQVGNQIYVAPAPKLPTSRLKK